MPQTAAHYNNSEYFGIGSGRIALSDYVMNGYNISGY
jgi:hypothetical protein